MADNNTISTILGTIGTVLWCVQLIPQIWFLYKRKNAEGFPPIFMLLWCVSGIFMAPYFIISASYIPMQVQPHLFTVLCSIAWIQAMYYPPHSYSKRQILLYAGAFYGTWIAIECGFAIWLRNVYAKGTKWPDLIFGVISSIFLAIGLLPPYFELAKRQGRVVGINFVFLAMDSSGAIFSLASLSIGEMDIMGMILYAIVLALEVGLFVSQIIWLLRFGKTEWKRKRKQQNDDEKFLENGIVEQQLDDIQESDIVDNINADKVSPIQSINFCQANSSDEQHPN